MKKIFMSLVCILILCSCSAESFLPIATEINQLSIIQMMAIDKDGDGLKVTLSKRDISDTSGESTEQSGDGQGGSQEKQSGQGSKSKEDKGILEAKGGTLSEALRKLQKLTDKKLFFGDLDYCFIGEAAAKEGLKKYVDYLSREADFKMNSIVYITHGDASELVKNSSQESFFLPDYLEVFLDDYSLQTSTDNIDLMDIFSQAYSSPSIVVIPTINITQEQGYAKVEVSGYCLFSDKKYSCRLSNEQATGYNILHGLLAGEVIDTKNSQGKELSLTVVKQKCNIKPVFENGSLKKVTIDCEIESNIAEDHSATNYSNDKELEFIEDKQKKIIKDKIEKCMVKLIENKTDAIFLFKQVRAKNNSYFNSVKKSWSEVFASIPYEVSIKSKVSRTYNSREEDS